MANNQTYEFPILKQIDRAWIDAAKKISEECEQQIIKIACSSLIAGVSFEISPDFKIEDELEEILKLESTLLRTLSIIMEDGIHVSVQRLGETTRDQAKITYQTPIKTGLEKEIVRITALVKRHFCSLDTVPSSSPALSEELRQHYEVRDAELSQLQSTLQNLSKELIDDTVRARKEISEEYKKQEKQLDEKIAKKEAELDQRREELEARAKELDLSEARAARRKLRTDLKEELKARSEKFELTKGTRRLRIPTTAFSILLLSVFGAGLLAYSYLSFDVLQGETNTGAFLAALARQFAFGAAFATTAIFFLKWHQKWFQNHAEEEFKQKRFDLDLDRASWIVETALDWKEQTGEHMPADIINRLSANLFQDENEPEESFQPADQLASAIFGASSGATLKLPGGTEVALDRKGIKRLQEKQEMN